MKRPIALRMQLTLLMALLVFLQSLALVMALWVSRVFYMLDAESIRLFESTIGARRQTVDEQTGVLVGNVAGAAEMLNTGLQRVADAEGMAPQELYLDNDAYNEVALASAEVLIELLRDNSITGAFMVLNGSNSDKTNPSRHSAVYIRNATPDSSAIGRNLQLEVGPTVVSSQYPITTSVGWALDMRFTEDEDGSAVFYEKPIWAAGQAPGAEIERYGYWSTPASILGDNRQVVCYTVPLMDVQGTPYGVLGIEISLTHFSQHYLPDFELPYPNSFYAITTVQSNALNLDLLIPSGPLAQVYLPKFTTLQLESVQDSTLHTTSLEGLGEMYTSDQLLTLYSANSPFLSENWSLVGFVPVSGLHAGSSGVRFTLITSIVITTLLSFSAIFLLAHLATRKISGLSRYVGSLSPYQDIHFQRTGMREIDELTSAVERLSRRVISASKTTSRILELTRLPIGGFEITSEAPNVILTGFMGSLLGIEPGSEVSKGDWDKRYREITGQPADGYENIYRHKDAAGTDRWLRILSTETSTGTVGVVLDVTRDIEENRRLARELDHDALTHLYNRTAFKREAYLRILSQPDKIGAMIFSDLDNLKYVNDTFGHDMGDRLIIRAGEMFRDFDLHGGIVSRISGDEFAVYLHGFDSKEEARAIISSLFQNSDPFSLMTPDGSLHRIRSSTGIAWYPDDSDNVTDLIKLSDYAMYEAKHNEKGSIREFSRKSYSENVYLLENREAINRLLDDGLIRFAYQPIVSLRTGEIYAYEALLRPLLDNFKSATEVLSVAATQSKLGQLERLVMFTAFQAIGDSIGQLGDVKIFVNSIPSHFLNEEDRVLLVRQYEHLFSNVVIEITEAESSMRGHLQKKVGFIQRAGMMLALDDYGSGYSNVMRILDIKPDIVKVDIAMIQGIHADADKQKLVASLVSFCHPKGILLVAEGVEDVQDLAEVIRLDVDFVQGYYMARPAFEFAPVDPAKRQEILDLQ